MSSSQNQDGLTPFDWEAQGLEAPERELAELDKRLFAWFLDYLLVTFPLIALLEGVGVADTLAGLILMAAYLAHASVWRTRGAGQTPGERLLHVRIVGADGKSLGARHYLGRSILFFICLVVAFPILWIVGLWVLSRPGSQAPWDRATKAHVIQVT